MTKDTTMPNDEELDRNLTLHQIYLMWLVSIKPSDFLRRNNILLHEIISFRGSQHNWGEWDG